MLCYFDAANIQKSHPKRSSSHLISSHLSHNHFWVSRSNNVLLPNLPLKPKQKPCDSKKNAPLTISNPNQQKILHRPRRLIHMPTLTQHSAQPLMHLRLKRLPRNPLPINTNIPIRLISRYDPVPQNLAVPDGGNVEEFPGFDGEHHLEGLHARNVAVDADEVHESVVGERGGEEVGVGSHVCHLVFVRI